MFHSQFIRVDPFFLNLPQQKKWLSSASASQRQALVLFVEKLWGMLDGLVNNVGTNIRKPIQEATCHGISWGFTSNKWL